MAIKLFFLTSRHLWLWTVYRFHLLSASACKHIARGNWQAAGFILRGLFARNMLTVPRFRGRPKRSGTARGCAGCNDAPA